MYAVIAHYAHAHYAHTLLRKVMFTCSMTSDRMLSAGHCNPTCVQNRRSPDTIIHLPPFDSRILNNRIRRFWFLRASWVTHAMPNNGSIL